MFALWFLSSHKIPCEFSHPQGNFSVFVYLKFLFLLLFKHFALLESQHQKTDEMEKKGKKKEWDEEKDKDVILFVGNAKILKSQFFSYFDDIKKY